MADRVLLIGKRAAVLTRLQAALRESGIEADLTQDTAAADRRQLREYDAVAFGRAVGEAERARRKEAFRAANHAVAFIDGLAPITPLLFAQFEQALDRRPEHERRVAAVTVSEGRIQFELRSPARVRVTVHRLTRLYGTRAEQLLDELLAPGIHTVTSGHGLRVRRKRSPWCEQTTTRRTSSRFDDLPSSRGELPEYLVSDKAPVREHKAGHSRNDTRDASGRIADA